MSRIQNLTEKRNDILHRMWFIGWGASKEGDCSDASSMKFDRNKSGQNIKVCKFSEAEFDLAIKEAEELTRLTTRLGVCLAEGWKIKKNFEIDNDGIVKGK